MTAKEADISTVTSFITYESKTHEAAQLYVSLIRNSKITGSIPGPNGSFSMFFFELDDRPYTAMNGGESFRFS